MGNMVNIRPWPISELNWSIAARRRTTAVLVDHLVAPDTAAGLSDALLNLESDLLKWEGLPEGALETRFRTTISEQIVKLHLDRDLHLDLGGERVATADELRRVIEYLGEIKREKVNVHHHVLGEAPPDKLLVPTIVSALGKRFLDGLAQHLSLPTDKKGASAQREWLRGKAEEAVALVLHRQQEPTAAINAVGGRLTPGARLPDELTSGFATAKKLFVGFAATHQEIDHLVLALAGHMVPPGPGNLPERNPDVVPTGRNPYVMNPEEIPSRSSFELGKQLVTELLEEKRKATGRYPERIGLSLDFRSTMMDYGVIESEMLALIGARPVWDASNRVLDVEVIPRQELGRPRIDVFIETYDYYADYLESRLRLWDKAVRLVSALDEPDNPLLRHNAETRAALRSEGLAEERAATLAQARIFAPAPEQVSFFHFMLLEETNKWETRRELVDAYTAERDYAYTEGSWGEKAPQAYQRQLVGTEIVLKNITRGGPLVSAGYNGANLSLVVKELTGKEPEYYLSDLRTPGEERLAPAEDLLRRDFRATVLNRHFIEATMKDDYAGAQRLAGQVFSTLMWKINREHSVDDHVWQEIADIYVRDSKGLGIRAWFDAKNPFAFQSVTERLLEAARKGYWQPDKATLVDIGTAYMQSVIRHGHREDGETNDALDAFLAAQLSAPAPGSEAEKAATALLPQYQQRAPAPEQKAEDVAKITGQKLVTSEAEKTSDKPRELDWSAILGFGLLTFFAFGFCWKAGGVRRGK